MANQDDKFGFEIDFLPVGDSTKSGDAICIRWGEDLSRRHDRQFVMVVDGGFSYSAGDVVRHIRKYYYCDEIVDKQKPIVDLLLNTHPHADHFGGIPCIYAETDVRAVLMHTPWTHTELPSWFSDGRVTARGIKDSLKDGLEAAYDFIRQLDGDGVPHHEPFEKMHLNLPYRVQLDVWGPSKSYYNSLLPDFSTTPTNGIGIGNDRVVLTGKTLPAEVGRLSNAGDTSAENLSGVIFTLKMPTGDLLLFTGDAGIDSLSRALNAMRCADLDLTNLVFFQVPHHGSVQNVGPRILNALLGTSQNPIQPRGVSAYISVAPNPDDAHPSRRVINALNERNCRVFKTQGTALQFRSGTACLHPGWEYATPLGSYAYVEG